jgi:hypothetical protein
LDERTQTEIQKRYIAAAESFIAKVRDDPSVIAVIVCGSLAYDQVWEKSDIDMALVVRDQPLKHDSYCIIEDGITINVSLMVRSAFKRGLERNIGGSFSQSYFAKGQIVFTTDDSLYEYFEDLKKLGGDDIALSALYIASELVGLADKCRKWLIVRKDPLYAQYYLLLAVGLIADMELCLKGEPASRQSIQKAIAINPALIKPLYQEAMSHHFSEAEIITALDRIDAYLEQHLDTLKRPVLEFLGDQEIKTVTLIAQRFRTQGHFIINIFDYLAQRGIIEKVSQTIRITPKGRQVVEEIGYLYIPDAS